MLLTEQPMCISITPKSIVKGLQINYVVTGINENQVTFTASQNGNSLETVTGERSKELTLSNRGSSPVELCWQKLDRKGKVVNFMVFDPQADLDVKATADTVEGLQSKIEGLQNILDLIQLNIVSQRDIEKEHFDRK